MRTAVESSIEMDRIGHTVDGQRELVLANARIVRPDEVVRGSTDGAEYNASVAYGTDWAFGNFTFGRSSSLQYINV